MFLNTQPQPLPLLLLLPLLRLLLPLLRRLYRLLLPLLLLHRPFLRRLYRLLLHLQKLGPLINRADEFLDIDVFGLAQQVERVGELGHD